MIRWCMVPEIWCAMDGQTDGKSDIYRWVPHLKTICRNKEKWNALGKNILNDEIKNLE